MEVRNHQEMGSESIDGDVEVFESTDGDVEVFESTDGGVEVFESTDGGIKWEDQFGDMPPGYEFEGLAGMGRCLVYKVRNKFTKQLFALKLIELREGKITANMARELSILFDVQHDRIVRLVRAIVHGKHLCLIMEFVHSDVHHHIKFCNCIDLKCVKKWLEQIVSAVSYLHKQNIIHRDIKPENILVTVDENIKLADFGIARCLFEDDRLTPQVTTLKYRAPEVLLGCETYTSAIDMWAVGCIFWDMVMGEELFKTDSGTEKEMIDQIFKKLGTPTEATWPGVILESKFPSDSPFYEAQILDVGAETEKIDADGLDLLRKLLILNPRERITAEEALEHPFLSKSPE